MRSITAILIALVIITTNLSSAVSDVLISKQRIETLKQRIQQKIEPNYSAYIAMQKDADANLNLEPKAPKHWHVPFYYEDAKGHREAKQSLSDSANYAYQFALCYRMNGQEKYAKSAIRIMNAWATSIETMSIKEDSTLSFSYHFPAMIFAADLLKDSPLWPKDEQQIFKTFVRQSTIKLNTMKSKNNWGNWGLVLVMACETYLEDEALFDTGVQRWKEFIERQIAEDGHLPHEVNRNEGRSGIWYSNFSLLPQTIAAEIALVNGVDLYDYQAPNGRTLRLAYDKLADWIYQPETFPYWKSDPKKLGGVTYISYFEILNMHWSNKKVSELLKKNRPLTASHSSPVLTFTHGNLLKANSN